jgi:PIN domain nuclease of toxin-antitoxin system
VRLLLDTQMVLWSAFWPHRMPRKAADALVRATVVYISSVSLFEIAIKASIGRLDIPFPEIETRLERASGAEPMPVTWRHAIRAGDIAIAHRDPYDRLLLAQAICESVHLLTSDAALASYGSGLVMLAD